MTSKRKNPRLLNKPASWKKQIDPNTKRMKALMRDVRGNVVRLTRNSEDLDTWLEKLAPYVASNCFVTGAHAEQVRDIINQLVDVVNQTSLPSGSNAEIIKGTMAEACMTMVTNVGEDIKTELQQIAVDSYNNKLAPAETAKVMGEKIDSLSKTRCEAIARTETCRAANIGNYINAKEMGARSYSVICNEGCCEYCQDEYGTDESGGVGDTVYDIEDTDNLPPLHPNSYHKDTQVFTEHGWKYIAELTGDEKLLSLNPDDDSLEFIKPVRLFKHKEPQLVHMHNKWFDVCVTPDHDCFVHKRKDGGKKGRYFKPQFRKPSELNSECHFVRCIDTDRESPEAININGLEFEPSDFAFFMAWYISEGSVLHDVEKAQMRKYPVVIAQQISENREIIQPVLEKVCDYLGLRMNITKNSFVIYSKELYDYLLPLGYSHEKYIPDEVFTLNKECLNIFLDNYVRGDGHERTHGRYTSVERSVFTSSVRLRDDLSYLILLCGYCPSISLHSHKGTIVEHKNGTYTQNYDIYGIRINSSKYATYSGLTVDRVEYGDYTYCVELPYWHTLWVMRNGKTSWNGNCRCTPVWSMKEPGE